MAFSLSRSDAYFLDEGTEACVRAAYRDGRLTATELVEQHIARVAAYDREGAALRAFITVNPSVLTEAASLDAEYRGKGAFRCPLYGIPIILKDNYNTKDMPTTGGNVAMKNSRPTADAFVVARMRAAGAIILGKANMTELARGGVSNSSLGGQVRNPYDFTRTPGGSSGGTAAALAAGFAVLGAGTDTGQSIRSPASACCLVGVRPTRGLISRTGIMPNGFTQDEAGPLARTVKDAALLLDVMAAYDPRDPITALGEHMRPASYVAALEGATLRGARIGVLTNLYGDEERHAEVNGVMDQVMRTMEAQGAAIVRFGLPAYDDLAANVSNERWEARVAMDAYFAELGPNQPVTSFRQLVESRTAVPEVQSVLDVELAIEDGLNNATYRERTANRGRLRNLIASKMAELRLDAILYPLQRVLPALIGSIDQPERNGVLSHGTGFPAVTFPGGFSAPTATAPIGIPIGAELLGLDFTEPKLLTYAHAFEQVARVRRPPVSTPALAEAMPREDPQ